MFTSKGMGMCVLKKERPRAQKDTRTHSKFTFAALGRIYGRSPPAVFGTQITLYANKWKMSIPKAKFSSHSLPEKWPHFARAFFRQGGAREPVVPGFSAKGGKRNEIIFAATCASQKFPGVFAPGANTPVTDVTGVRTHPHRYPRPPSAPNPPKEKGKSKGGT